MAKYHKLPGDDESVSLLAQARDIWHPIIATCAVVILVLVSFVAGQLSISLSRDSLSPPGGIQVTWEHNLTFSSIPSPDSEAAWTSLVPAGRGFIQHPSLSPAPKTSAISVFHELHCLHGIRAALYTLEADVASLNNSAPPNEFLESLGARTNLHHIRHCFDYLRQALMCAADMNLEPVDQELHSTTGWGVQRTCRNYDAVKAFAERWALNNSTVIE